jgi:hypothetical protein
MVPEQRPIGYWLKLLDRLIDESFDRAIGEHGLTRRHWQVMSVLAHAPARERELADALAPFLGDPTEIAATSADLVDRQWIITAGTGKFELTDLGREAQIRISQRVMQTRQVLVAGISAADYRCVVDVLGRMAGNLEAAMG